MAEISRTALPDEVDGIFVGGGHNSLVAAAYLARAGVRVLVLEAAPVIGGGVTTAEASLPLFRHNLHAFFVRWTADYTIWNDLDLDRFGVRSIFPEVQNGIPFEGGERALVTYRDVERSVEAIGHLDPADAEAYRRLHTEMTEITERIEAPLRFAPPLPDEELADLLSASPLGRRYLDLAGRSALDVVCEAFRSEPLRALVLFNVAVRGYLPNLDVPGTGPIVALALPNSHEGRIIAGGSLEMARALAACVFDAGGTVLTSARVAAIDVSSGRAQGVTLDDGRRVRATRFVASSVPAPMTMLELVGREHLDSSLADTLGGFRWLEEALFGVHWALSGRPRFTAEADAPDLPRALNLALGYESTDDLVAHMEDLRAARISAHGAIHSSLPAANDPSQAPPGLHTSFGWHFVPGPSMRGRWDEAADRDRLEAMTATYRRYAPDIDDLTLAVFTHSPDDTERHVPSMRSGDRHHGSYHPANWGFNRPSPAMPGYRTPIEGLYLCGASQHPGGSFTGQPGYNAAGAVADDLGLDPWWGPPDARAALSELA